EADKNLFARLEGTKGDDGKEGETAKAEDFKARAERLFAKALEMSDKNPGVQALIDEAAKTRPGGTEGTLRGRRAIGRHLRPGGADSFEFRSRPGLPGYISLSADFRVHTEIIRPNGNYVVDQVSRSAEADFTPPNDFGWTVRIRNVSGKVNNYSLY